LVTPEERTAMGKTIQEWLLKDDNLTQLQCSRVKQLLNHDFLTDMQRLSQGLVRHGHDWFKNELLSSNTGSVVVQHMQLEVFPAVTLSRRVESSFRLSDFVAGAHGGPQKLDAADPAADSARTDLVPMIMVVRERVTSLHAEASRAHLREKGFKNVHGRSQAREVKVATMAELMRVAPTVEHWEKTREHRSGQRKRTKRVKNSVSQAELELLNTLESSKSSTKVISTEDILVPMRCLCFADERCLREHRVHRGAQSYVMCRGCGVRHHKVCVDATPLKDTVEVDGKVHYFYCKSRDGRCEGSNGVENRENARLSSEVFEGEKDALNVSDGDDDAELCAEEGIDGLQSDDEDVDIGREEVAAAHEEQVRSLMAQFAQSTAGAGSESDLKRPRRGGRRR
jgi:Pyruvate/2-oxoacid:ferredoxin oxidoreductase delta subunit